MSIGRRAVGYLQSADLDHEGNITIQGPTGFRVIVPNNADQADQEAYAHAPRHVGEEVEEEEESLNSEDFTGRYTPLLTGRIVFGPQPMRFFFSCFVLLILLGLLAFQSSDIVRECGHGTVALGFLLNMITLVTFCIICLNDPGVIPDSYRLRELIWDTEEYRSRNPEARFYRYCETCRGYRPPRSKHCDACDICIRDHETHLFAGGTCVGQRTARSLITLSLTVGLYTLYLVVTNSIILHNGGTLDLSRKIVAVVSIVFGVLLLFTPQLGFLLFVFRLYLVGQGYTGSSYLNRKLDYIACPSDERSSLKRYSAFFFGKKAPSIFRKKPGQVGPESGRTEAEQASEDWLSLMSLPAHRMPLIQELMRLQNERSPIHMGQGFRRMAGYTQNNYSLSQHDNDLSGVAAAARPKSIPSDPQLYNRELDAIPIQRLRKGIKSNVCDTLYQRMEDAKNKQHHHTSSTLGHPTLSEGSLPRFEETRHLVTSARAQQFRRLIHLVLSRDREGLEEMGRTVNIPALLGVNQFDPDNFQFVELSNGLPMLAPRRDDGRQPNLQNRGAGALLGIPQMVAAGLLPPARQLAQDMENSMGGPGSIRRVTNPITNRIVYQSLRHPPHNRQAEAPGPRLPLGFPLLDSNPGLISLLYDNQQIRRDMQDRLRRVSLGFLPGMAEWRRSRGMVAGNLNPVQIVAATPPPAQPPSGGVVNANDVENNNNNNNNNRNNDINSNPNNSLE